MARPCDPLIDVFRTEDTIMAKYTYIVRQFNGAYSSSSKVKWAFIGSLEVEIESVSTHKISAKVMP